MLIIWRFIMALVACPDCGNGVSKNAESCPKCGSPIAELYKRIPPESVNCSECKNDYSFHERKCPHCGLINGKKLRFDNPLEEYKEIYHSSSSGVSKIKESKSRSAAILLAIFFGGIGVHKFYLNKPGQGIIYLLLFWTGIPLIISLIEAIRFLMMSDSSFNTKYC